MTVRLTRRETLTGLTAIMGASPAVAAMPSAGAVMPRDLRVDHLVAPAGIATARPRFSWTLAARDPLRRGVGQSAARVVVSDRTGGLLSDSGRIEGAVPVLVPSRDLDLPAQAPLDWRVMIWDQDGEAGDWSIFARLLTGVAGAWRGGWIAGERDGPVTAPPSEGVPPVTSAYVLPLLRRAFTIDRPVRHAVVSLAGLGAHALSVNGREPSAGLLDPGWTDYRKTVLYETIDITDCLRIGDNMIGVRLGGGMYDVASRPGRYTKFTGSFGAPKLILQLHIVHDDGSERWIVSDADWQTRPGPITFVSIYGGEDHDASRERPGWDRPGAEGEGWGPVIATGGPGGTLRPQTTPGLRVIETLAPIAVTHPAAGIAVHDLGRTIAGRPRLTVRATPGTTIRITPGELLDQSGHVTQTSMGAGPDHAIRFTYTAGDGADPAVWTPRFSYTGFRYLEVAGDGHVALVGDVLRAALPETGRFTCSDPHLVAIHDLIRGAVLSNVATIITDCPHREKLGWLEQTWLNADTIFHTLDAQPLYAKLIDDIADAQRDDGMVPSIAPEYIRFVDRSGRDTPFRHSPEWGSAVVQGPWAAYRFGGDPAILARGYPAMCRYLAYLEAQSVGNILDVGLGDWYDIGPRPPGEAQLTSRAFTGTAIWYADLCAMVKIAAILGHDAHAAPFADRAARLKATINGHFLDRATGHYDRNSQTANAMALALDLVPENWQDTVLAHLVADIAARGDHVSAGDIGFHYVVRALGVRAPDRLLAMLARRDAPSYGAQLARGATTLTEAWDADPHASQNHFMLGHALAWLYRGVAGIDLDFARGRDEALLLAPPRLTGIAGAGATLACAVGMVRSRWRVDRGRMRIDVTIPAGATARLRIPTRDIASVREGGAPIASARGIRPLAATPVSADFRLLSGTYAIEASIG